MKVNLVKMVLLMRYGYKLYYLIYLDFHLVEGFAIVNTNNASDHLRHNDHVTQMCLHALK